MPEKVIKFIKINNLQYNALRDPQVYRRVTGEPFRIQVVVDGTGEARVTLADEKGEMRAAKLKNLVNGEESELEVACVFVAIGHVPNSGFLGELVDKDENGYILQTPGRTSTKTPGLFAAGDVADHYYRQAITAAGQGCAAALEAERYLSGHA